MIETLEPDPTVEGILLRGEHLVPAIDRADAAMYQEKHRRKIVRGSGSPAA